jgi:hypothetical protein
MHAQPMLFEKVLGQHFGLKDVVANISIWPSGKGIGCLGRDIISITPWGNGCSGVIIRLG